MCCLFVRIGNEHYLRARVIALTTQRNSQLNHTRRLSYNSFLWHCSKYQRGNSFSLFFRFLAESMSRSSRHSFFSKLVMFSTVFLPAHLCSLYDLRDEVSSVRLVTGDYSGSIICSHYMHPLYAPIIYACITYTLLTSPFAYRRFIIFTTSRYVDTNRLLWYRHMCFQAK